MRWEVTALGRRMHNGSSNVEIDIDTDLDGTETFTRTTNKGTFTTTLSKAHCCTLTERCGRLTIHFYVETESCVTLRCNRSNFCGLPIPRFLLDVSGVIETTEGPTTTIHSNVSITLLSILRLCYAAVLTERPTS